MATFDERPESLLQCLNEAGEIDVVLYNQYQDRVDDEVRAKLAAAKPPKPERRSVGEKNAPACHLRPRTS